jgi:hypothetical protein
MPIKQRFSPLKLEDFLTRKEYFADDIPPITPPDIKEKKLCKPEKKEFDGQDKEALFFALLQVVKEANDRNQEIQEKIVKENKKSRKISADMRQQNAG